MTETAAVARAADRAEQQRVATILASFASDEGDVLHRYYSGFRFSDARGPLAAAERLRRRDGLLTPASTLLNNLVSRFETAYDARFGPK